MNIWKELLKTALLGTERGSLSEKAQKYLSEQGINLNASPEQQVLEGVAFYSQMKKAAFPLEEAETDFQPVVQTQENFCSPKATRHLNQILEGTYDKALKEFIWYCQQAKKILHPESLPDLFYQSLSDPLLWQHIQALIGQRGQWLLPLNPDWQPLSSSNKVENWPYADKMERLAILRYLRAEQPERAIKLLESTWISESPADKQTFLKTLEINLSKGDETFLEKCLQDKRKEVRETAVELLQQLPNSAYMQRMNQRAKEWVSLSKSGEIVITIPENPDKQTRIDCLIGAKKSGSEWKKTSAWAEFLFLLPPKIWEVHFGQPPTQCFRYFYQTHHWRHVSMDILLKATVLHKDEDWMRAILDFWLEKEPEQYWNNHPGKQFIAALPNTVFNEFVIQNLGRSRPLLQEDSLISHLLCQGVQFWSDSLTLPLIRKFQKWMTTANAFDWSAMHYKKILEVAAYRAKPELYKTLKDGWPYRSPAWYKWQKEVERMLKVLTFRKEMIAALSS